MKASKGNAASKIFRNIGKKVKAKSEIRTKNIHRGDLAKIDKIKNRSGLFDSQQKRDRDIKPIQTKIDKSVGEHRKMLSKHERVKARNKLVIKKYSKRAGAAGLALTGAAGYVAHRREEKKNSWENAAKERLRRS
jgi:hypothetical protein